MDKTAIPASAAAFRRQQQLEDCLHENLLHHPYVSISVSDLCSQVGISRKAFYNYFHSKDDCLLSLMKRSIRETILHTEALDPRNISSLEGSIRQLSYWKNNRAEFLDILIRNELVGHYLWANVRYFAEEEPVVIRMTSTSEVTTDTDLLCSMACALISLIIQWYLRGFDTPVEEMARKYRRMLKNPMFPEQE